MSRRFTSTFHDELRARLYPGQLTIEEALGQNSDPEDRPSTSVSVSDRTLLEKVALHRTAMADEKRKWVAAVYAASDAGFTNTQIAGMSRMTEAGIRQLLKRNRRPRSLDRT